MATNKYDRRHQSNLSAYEREIDRLYRQIITQSVAIGLSLPEIKPDTLFSFDDYPAIRQRVEKLLQKLQNGLSSIILNGIKSEWTLANNKNSELARQVFGDNVGKLTQEQYRRYFNTNDSAREAFEKRKVNGLNLSDRVWRYTDQFKAEIELGLDVGIRNGLSADELSRDLRNYLQHPDKLFRRVRDEHGELQLSKHAAAFHPGRGVYRSSYKNARRLAATETNMAYMTADYERWQQLDFIVGIRIELSNNHTLNGQPFTDICDRLSAPLGSKNTSGKGCYPKDFKFTGWHPLCRCHVVSILKTDEEIAEDTRRILDGEPLDGKSVNRVDDVPQEFKQWLKDNEERAKRSYSVPYFIKDNPKYLPKGYSKLYAMRMPYDTHEEYASALAYNKKHAGFSAAIAQNNRELAAVLPVLQGKIMNFAEADGSRCNPKFAIENARELGYYDNCQTCTVAYELRRRGFNVEAMSNKDNEFYEKWCVQNKFDWQDRFLTEAGKRANYTISRKIKDNGVAKLKFIEDNTMAQGRYEVYCAWKDSGYGHVFIVERQKDGNLLWFDPQSSRRGGWQDFNDDYINKMRHDLIGVLRIDDKLINPQFSPRLKKSQ